MNEFGVGALMLGLAVTLGVGEASTIVLARSRQLPSGG
jgi:hypothetical protein